jgi:uncharacterized membrane protein HdeD (DUF308 family)
MPPNSFAATSRPAGFTASLQAHWRLFLAEGVALAILGLLAIVLPPIATFAVEVVIGWLLLVSGVIGLISTFSMRLAPGFWWSLLSAAVAIAAGVVLLGWPVSGAVSLTLVLAIFLAVEGFVSVMYAFEHRRGDSGRWGWMLASGVIDVILAWIIFAGLPATAAWAIGLLVGINLVFGGTALIGMALHARSSQLLPPGPRPNATTSYRVS